MTELGEVRVLGVELAKREQSYLRRRLGRKLGKFATPSSTSACAWTT